jgi:hypothetical protein
MKPSIRAPAPIGQFAAHDCNMKPSDLAPALQLPAPLMSVSRLLLAMRWPSLLGAPAAVFINESTTTIRRRCREA